MINISDISGRKSTSARRSFRAFLAMLWLSLGAVASAQPSVTLAWDPPVNNEIAGYILYYGHASQNYSDALDVGLQSTTTINNLLEGTNYYFTVTSYTADGLQSPHSGEVTYTATASLFFEGENSLSNHVSFLQFPGGNPFGYYNLLNFPLFYHYDLGFEYFFEANDGNGGAYLYDFSSDSFWYTSPAVFPYIYDFKLSAWLYYYPDANNPGHYTSMPRYFYNFNARKVITK